MAQPLYGTAGGKRAAADTLLARFPDPADFDFYGEPFFGGGAIYFAAEERGLLADKVRVLGDANRDAIRLLREARERPGRLYARTLALVEEMISQDNPGEYFTTIRDLWNCGGAERRPEYHLFLRVCAFNDLWRVNRDGELNSSWNQECPPRIPTADKIHEVSCALQGTDLVACDFRVWESAHADPEADAEERALAKAAHASGTGIIFVGARWVILLDPPYLGGWTGYTAKPWTEQDLQDLLRLAALWSRRGARVIVTHADEPRFIALRRELWPEADVSTMPMRRSINSDGTKRGPVDELVAVSGSL